VTKSESSSLKVVKTKSNKKVGRESSELERAVASYLPSAGGAADGSPPNTTVAEESAYKQQARPLSGTGLLGCGWLD
jgi:hypothetical protein